ncbi:MraY family glycosyltransferase [Streptomyces tagetis]|uniref:Undecaprenyl/decaprenyl-phosphate alpha-N-acetylglucosaminyl 1-phosphate transferase n=1 Tax=Streptomyces tagetis TaxID=2820809 RepID=A0A940XPL7_9ACTN|nr:undecaprenyl/decaprenyl-phosphate alpha-N-acetylglucosaminyl 1-phosphate transferase [Streptomyces sp. RG38]
MLYGIAAATASFLLAALLTALLRAPALRLGLTDRRRRRPVPVLGGVAVLLVTCLVAVVCDRAGLVPLGSGTGRLLAAAAAVGGLGLVADLLRLRRRWVLAGTAVAAACAVPYAETGIAAGLCAALWIALVATAFRGLDHADGAAGTVGVVTAFGVGICAAAELMDGLAVLLSVLAAALTGFLLHNWHPARITLGTSGSAFTGFLLAGGAVFSRAGHGPGTGAGVLFVLTAVVSADGVLFLLARRSARGAGPRGPGHLVQRLRRLGLTAQGTVVFLGAGALCGVVAGVLVHTGGAGETAVAWVAGGWTALVLGVLRAGTRGARRDPRPTGVRPVRTSPRAVLVRAAAPPGPRTGVSRGRSADTAGVSRAHSADTTGVSRAPRGGGGVSRRARNGRIGVARVFSAGSGVSWRLRFGRDGVSPALRKSGAPTGVSRGLPSGATGTGAFPVRGGRGARDAYAGVPEGTYPGPGDAYRSAGPDGHTDHYWGRLPEGHPGPLPDNRPAPLSDRGVPLTGALRRADFPVRQATPGEKSQVTMSLRVRNG